MGPVMTDDASKTDDLVRRAKAGDEPALAALFTHYRERLKRMVRLRLDRRLSGRVTDAGEVGVLSGEADECGRVGWRNLRAWSMRPVPVGMANILRLH